MLVVVLTTAAFTGGTTHSLLSDTETITAAVNVDATDIDSDSWSVESKSLEQTTAPDARSQNATAGNVTTETAPAESKTSDNITDENSSSPGTNKTVGINATRSNTTDSMESEAVGEDYSNLTARDEPEPIENTTTASEE